LKITGSGADNTDYLALNKVELSLVKQYQWGVGKKSKCFWIVGIDQKQGLNIVFLEVFFRSVYGFGIFFPAFKVLNMSDADTLKGLEIYGRSLENGCRTARKLPQFLGSDISQTGDKTKEKTGL
jgi:hypothetical protein